MNVSTICLIILVIVRDCQPLIVEFQIAAREIQAKYEDFEVEEDPIEESSSASQDTEGSDEEWAT
ncbi:hypothetical protein BT93_C0694 [Corymbia citriodora subsp. variegata]|nr:hypothetical protein BT93_C0694 [Corymbia citriodora subsp. variegata]